MRVNHLKIGNNMLEYKGPKIWADAEIIYEMKFWHEIEERDYLKNKQNKNGRKRRFIVYERP